MKEAIKEARKEAQTKTISEVFSEYPDAVEYYRAGFHYYAGALTAIVMWRLPDADPFAVAEEVWERLK